MKKVFFAALMLFAFGNLSAQYNLSVTYCNHNDINASRYEPSELHFGKKHFQLSGNYYLWAGNNALNYGVLKQIHDSKQLTDADVDEFISRMPEKNNAIGVGQDYQILGLGFQIKNTSFSLSVVDKFGFDINYSKKFMQLLWKGNKQFAGQNVELGPLSINTQYSREYVLGTAFQISGDLEDLEKGVRLGARAKFIQGLGALYMPKADVSLYTEPDGRYLDANFDYQLNTSGLNDLQPFAMNGTGFGADVGATFVFSRNFEIAASALDLGYVSYTKNLKRYEKKGNHRYDGMFVSNFFGDPEINTDSVAALFQPIEIEGQGFNMPLATKIMLQAELKLGKKDSEEDIQSPHSFFITYVQGLNNMPGGTKRPYFSVAYNYDLHKFFDIGASAAYGGYNKLAVGAFFSLNLFHTLKLGIGSDNITPLVIKSSGTGIDVSLNASLSF